jgi:putative ABC transport system permease protein
MENLITANIRSRPTRTFISILAVALGIMIMLVIGGIVKGTLNEYLGRTVALGADYILQPPGSSVLYAFSDASLNAKLAVRLRQTPGISAVTPVLSKFSASHFGLVFGIDLPSYNQFPGRLQMIEGNPTLTGDEIVVDQIYAEAKKIRIGTVINFLDHDFRVTGICRAGSIVRVFVPLETLQKLLSTTDKVTILFAKAAPSANQDQIFRDLKQQFPHYSLIRASDPTLLLAETPLPGLKEFRITVILISMALSFMVILLAMYTTIFERTREIGILKSLGASQRFIVGMILKESVMICGLGALLGIIASEIIRKIIITKIPTLQVAMSFNDLMQGMLLGLVAGILGALYPAYKAARMDPVRALSFE